MLIFLHAQIQICLHAYISFMGGKQNYPSSLSLNLSVTQNISQQADIPEEDLTKDSENSSVKRPTTTIADFLEEAEWTEAADSSAADVAVDRSDSLLTDEASADTAALVGSPIQTLEAIESEQEAEEESSRGKVRLVSVEEFLDDTQEESELRCKPEQEESCLKGPEKEKEVRTTC